MTPRPILLATANPAGSAPVRQTLEDNGASVRVMRPNEVASYFARKAEAITNREESPAVILIDGGPNEAEPLLRQLKNDPSLKLIPIVLLCVSANETDTAASYALGANSVVVKSSDPDQFKRALTVLTNFWAVFNQPAKDPRAETEPIV